MNKNPPEGYVFYERNSPQLIITWSSSLGSFNLRGWKLDWPELTDLPRKKPDFIKRSGWVELGPIAFQYFCGRRALNEEKSSN